MAYNLAVPSPGRIPDRLTYHARHNSASAGTGFISLRLAVTDDADNTVRTTVIRAYRLVERG